MSQRLLNSNMFGEGPLTVDASGNLLVGKTAANSDTAGFEANASGFTAATRDNGTTFVMDRLTSDGEILSFRQDNTTVGSIGTIAGDLTIGENNAGLRFDSENNVIQPHDMGSNSSVDNQVNLGTSTNRFKDLYLSGGVYVGGTAAANLLDDYEEGTWTPAYSTTGTNFSSITYNTTFTSGTYVKVGRNVTLRGYIRTEALTVGSATGGVIVTGIPFTSSNGVNTTTDTRCAGSVLSTNFSADGPSTLVINNNKTYFECYAHNTIGSGTSAGIVNAADMATGTTANIMTFILNYYVD